VNRFIAALAVSLFLVAPAMAQTTQVQVRIPVGLQAGFSGSDPSPDGMTYVTVDGVRVTNPSSTDFGAFEPRDFHLVADGRTYYPVARPGLEAVDLSWSGIVPPRGTLLATVTFRVPRSVTVADLEFVPRNWFADDGSSVAFCCLYL
jgi:hypothetical protein